MDPFSDALDKLGSPDEDTRREAVRALAGSGDARAVARLAGCLRDDPEQSVRREAAIALRAFTGSPTVAALIQALRQPEESWQVRAAAAESLGLLGDAGALPALMEAAGPEDYGLALAATNATRRFGPRAIQPLLAAYAAASSSRRLFFARMLAGLARPDVLRQMLQANSPALRQAAAQALVELGDPQPVLNLWSGNWAGRQTAASAFVLLPPAQARDALLAALDDPDLRVRSSALESMADSRLPALAAPEIAQAVSRALLDPASPETRTAARALVNLPGVQAAQWVEQALHAQDASIRMATSRAVTEAGAGRRIRSIATLDKGEPPPAASPVEPPPRYADLTFYSGGRKPANQVAPQAPLRTARWYELEVAIRLAPTGIPSAGDRRPVREPHQEGPVELTVTLTSGEFEIPDQVQPLTLPPTGDSTGNAWFQVRPLARSASAGNLARIQVRVFYRYNLLEVLTLQAEVAVDPDPDSSRFGLARPVFFRQDALQCAYTDLDDLSPRELHIEVSRPGADYVFAFTLADRLHREITLTGSASLRAPQLEDSLLVCRRLLEEIALSDTFLKRMDGTDGEWRAHLSHLARAGRDLWIRLFKSTPRSALATIGRMLEQNPLVDGGMVQVSIRQEAADFVFPWSLLYDRPLPEKSWETPDPAGFWGARYPIEQFVSNVARDDDAPIDVAGPLKMMFVLWQNFRNAADEVKLMQDLGAEAAGRLVGEDPPVLSRNEFYTRIGACDSQILYFYTHGHTRRRLDQTAPDFDAPAFLKRFDSLPPDSPARLALQPVYDSLQHGDYEPDRSWIQLTYGKLYLEELLDRVSDLSASHPLVILNMCESAQVVPSLTDSFIHFFLACGASAVIGTECPMTIETAHPFAQQFLTAVLGGQPAGQALVDARRYFFAHKNPLGLAYTLFGSATARFEPPALVAQPPSPPGGLPT